MSLDRELEGAENSSSFSFADMRLRVNDRIQLQPPAALGLDRYMVKLIGYVDNISVMVNTPSQNGMRLQLREGDKLVARVFSSQKAFAFDCYVNRVNTIPFAYLHLSFPEKIQGSIIRKSPRIKIKIIATAKIDGASAETAPLTVIIANLSADGALLQTSKPMFERNQKIVLSFQIKLHHTDTLMMISAIVRNIVEDDSAESGKSPAINHGLQFVDLEKSDNMILQSLIYQQMIEQPHTVM